MVDDGEESVPVSGVVQFNQKENCLHSTRTTDTDQLYQQWYTYHRLRLPALYVVCEVLDTEE